MRIGLWRLQHLITRVRWRRRGGALADALCAVSRGRRRRPGVVPTLTSGAGNGGRRRRPSFVNRRFMLHGREIGSAVRRRPRRAGSLSLCPTAGRRAPCVRSWALDRALVRRRAADGILSIASASEESVCGGHALRALVGYLRGIAVPAPMVMALGFLADAPLKGQAEVMRCHGLELARW
jgi:hypothetical protein